MNDSSPLRCKLGWHKWSENRGGIQICRRCEAATTFGLTGAMRRLEWQKELREKNEKFEEQEHE